MKTTRIIPGLVVDEAMLEAAAAALPAHAPELGPLSWECFTAPANWWMVPDEAGDACKAELVLREDTEATVKVNLWLLPDRRAADGRPAPHSHPWDFRSWILLGGYDEDRYELSDGHVRADLAVAHRSGTVNEIDRALYHEVTGIHEPGRTLSLMVCGPGVRGSWGYLDPDTGRCVPSAPDPGFTDRLRALNPHRTAGG
ncbi:hypothetical protein AB0A98_38305 [Streptomyces chrestomyceticus]|uniref:hypothetical protein n=1 Tax=Streptomyces chrestomyceticus TaxID=68185 RepID=UPI0033E90AFC